MAVKQVTVFIANKEGRIEKVTQVLKDNDINITSLSLAESEDFGLLRLIVSDAERAKNVLKEAGLSAKTTDVIAVQISNEPGSLHDLLIAVKEYNIEYMYVLTAAESASMVMKIRDVEGAEKVLRNKGFVILSEQEVNETVY